MLFNSCSYNHLNSFAPKYDLGADAGMGGMENCYKHAPNYASSTIYITNSNLQQQKAGGFFIVNSNGPLVIVR